MIIIKKTAGLILDLIYPPICPFCKELLPLDYDERICGRCKGNLDFIAPNEACHICGRKIEIGSQICGECYIERPVFNRNVSIAIYDGAIKNVIYSLKYGNRRYIAKLFARLVFEHVDSDKIKGAELLIPVPMFGRKKAKRGFNQAELFANGLSEIYDIPVDSDSLIRIKDTPPQSGLSIRERKENIKDAFILKDSVFIKDKDILLIDDIYTTGSTLNECVKILLQGGAKQVNCITFAITAIEERDMDRHL